ncbi:MAG: hypothetical protein ACOYWZ_23845 [Bacillota bacterium]
MKEARRNKSTIKEKLNRAIFINKIYNIFGAIQGVSLGLAIVILISFFAVFPAGYIEGKTPIMQSIMVYLNPKLFFILALCLILLFMISLFLKRYIKKKYSSYIL